VQAKRQVNNTIEFSGGTRLLRHASTSGRSGYGSERDQLKATIYGCTDEVDIRDLLAGDPEFFKSLTERKSIKDVPVIDDNNRATPFLDQIVARVYALRCRVVHAKADGGDAAVDLLLPGSNEAKAMAADVALAQFIAQKAIVAGASALQ
jgi:hypothetical protein